MSITVRETDSKNGIRCLYITNESIELLVTIEYGPEIIGFQKKSERCLFFGGKDGCEPQGHRMWLVSEHEQNYDCNRTPVIYTPLEDGVHFVQSANTTLPIELGLDIMITSDSADIMVIHSLTNKSNESVKLSIHTETKFNPDGFIFVPQSNVRTENAPGRILTLWPDCKWGDSRLFLGNQYVTVTHQSGLKSKLKIGSNNTAGWSGYISDKNAFIKRYIHNRNALYPFYGSSTYAYSESEYLSIQTASPFYIVAPNETARHVENWTLPCSVTPCDPKSDLSIDNFINSI